MRLLIAAAGLWLVLHLGVAGSPLRRVIVRYLGENAFRGVFSLLSLVSLYILVHAWSAAPGSPVWYAPGWLRVLLVLVMLPAFVLFVSAFRRGAGPPRGMVRITRHPMLWSFALWGVVHMIGSGDAPGLVFFGTFVVTALAGMPSIDAKQARREPAEWADLSATTSIIPFGAILQGRNRLVAAEIGWWCAGLAVLLWGVLLWLHPSLFGVAALPPSSG